MMRRKSVFICNRSHSRLVDSSRNRTFSRGYHNLMRSYGGLLEPKGSKVALLKSTFNAENFIRRLYWSISSDFDAVHSWNMCGRLESRKKITKTPIFGVQGRSRSLMLVAPESSSAVLVMIGSKSVSIGNRFHARRANSGKITISKWGYPCLMPSFQGSLLTQRHQIIS